MAFREASLETSAPAGRVWMMGGTILKTFNSVLNGLKQKVESS